MGGIALAPLVTEIKVNLMPFTKGIDEASKKGSDFEKKMQGVNKELKLTESGFKVAASSAELMGNKFVKLSVKQNELTEKMKLQSRAIDINKEAYTKIENRLQKYIAQNDKLKSSIEKTTKEHSKAEKAYGKEAEETKKLADKLNSLNEKLENNKKKIQATNEKLDNQKIKLNEWQAELLQSQNALNKTNKELKEFNLTQMSEKLGKVSSGLESIGSNLTTHVSLPLAGVATVASHVGIEFEAQMDKVSAISGATGEDFDKLQAKAEEMGAKTKFSATNAGEAMEYMAMAGWKTGDMLNGIEPILNLAIASGEELGTTSDIVTDALTAFGLSAKDAGMFSDVLAAASSNANTNVGMMGETFKYAAPVAGSLGYTIQDTALAIGLMANSGIKASQAGTALRAGLTNLVKPSKQMAKVIDKYGISLKNSNGEMKSFKEVMEDLRSKMGNLDKSTQAAAVSALFGKEAMSGWLAIINASEQDFNKLASAIDTSQGATEKMAKTMSENAKGSIDEMKSALEEAAIKGFKVIAPIITDVANGVSDLANKFSGLSPETQKLILKLGTMAVAAGPILSITGKATSGVVKLIDYTKKFKTALTATEAVMQTTTLATEGLSVATTASGVASGTAALGLGSIMSVALPLVAVVGAVAGGIYLYTKNTEVMSSTSLQAKEDLGLVGNALLALHGDYALTTEEMDKMNIKHKEWSSEVSPEAQKALTEISDKIAKLNYELEYTNGLDGVITRDQIDGLKKRTDDLFNETIEKIKQRAPETQKMMADAFKADDGKLDENEQKLEEFFNQSQSKQIEELKGYQKKVNDIYEAAAKENRDLREDEIKTIEELTIKMGNVNLSNTVKSHEELLAAQADFNARMKNLDMNGISELLSEKAKARDKEIEDNKIKYDKLIETMKLKMPEMNEEQKKYAQIEIEKWESLKTEAINKERDKYQGFLNEAMKKYPQLIDYINTSNGEIMDKEDKVNYKRLTRYSQNMDKMMGITQTGYYKIYNETDKRMHDCYVEVDEASGRINGVWDNTTKQIYGNPIKAREDIREDIKNGAVFKPIAENYHSGTKEVIWNDSIKVQCEKDWDMFGWVKSAWNGVRSWFSSHPISVGTTSGFGGAASFKYNGLDYVPYDGYLARLHKGERIMTADENARYSENNSQSTIINFNGNYGFKDRNDIDYFMNQAALKLKGVR
ncbi:MAG: phage tail tape measure protein [Clostridium perfringens]|nr:phage tail tape measure protein [Clostridium perfringens]MDU4828496.1 phage tail tape measure protein [Clostridium perfringens]